MTVWYGESSPFNTIDALQNKSQKSLQIATSGDATSSNSVRIPLRKHVDLPDASIDVDRSMPSTYWTVELQIGCKLVMV